MKKKFFITTAIDYANGRPHLGHAYEKVLTDVVARFRRMMGDEVHFLTGVDEHGQKVTQTAKALGKSPEALTNELAPLFVELCKTLLISNDDFIRTSEARHKEVVRSILQDLYDRGDIYKARYSGYYSVRQEQFVLEKEKVDGEWPEIYGEVVEIEEENYFFRLSKYQEWLVSFLKENEFVFPLFRQKQVTEFLKDPVNDLCISRPVERLSWGIRLPFDEDFVTYVWFDALINYISAVSYGTDRFGEYWPCDYHVIGKDILVPAHAVYWPIMLKAMGAPLPKSLLVHGWWHTGGAKLSKSSGVSIDPFEISKTFGPDALRFFLTREMNVGQDSDFTMELFLSRYNADLANNYGNLVNRLLNLSGRHLKDGLAGATVEGDPEHEVRALWEKTREDILRLYEGFQFHTALDRIFTFITALNRYAEVRAPWKLAKSEDPSDRAVLETSLAVIAEGVRLATVAVIPVMPGVAERVLGLLREPMPSTWEGQLEWGNRLQGRTFGERAILFPRPG